jgi:hypothetical protein
MIWLYFSLKTGDESMIETITGIGLLIVALAMLTIGAYFAYYFLNKKVKGKQTARGVAKACADVNRAIAMRNATDYFWKDPMPFIWISIFLLFFISLGFVTHTFFGLLSSILFIIISIFFGIFAYKSYSNFETKAKARLTEFENAVKASIEQVHIIDRKDPIGKFTKIDEAFDTDPDPLYFATGITKIAFPPFEKNPKKQPIIHTKKIEVLILARDYFCICKGATPFNLLEPKLGPVPKKCPEVRAGGECDEYYYSQMQNVKYDPKNECIRIIYHAHTGHEDVVFPCKKVDPNRKKAMDALKEKLRLTERQKLQKIQEHKSYEDIKDKRSQEESQKEE